MPIYEAVVVRGLCVYYRYRIEADSEDEVHKYLELEDLNGSHPNVREIASEVRDDEMGYEVTDLILTKRESL